MVNLTNRAKLSATVTLAVYSGLLVFFNIQAPELLTRIASCIPLAIVGLLLSYDKYWWRMRPLFKLAQRPYIAGTWRGRLVSNRRDENDRPISTEHEVALVIRQDFTTVSVTLLTAESKSVSTIAEIVKVQDNDYQLNYMYSNTPRQTVRHRSPKHDGASCVVVGGASPTTIEGEYWTERESRGTYKLELVSRSVASTYDEASQLNI